MKWCLLAKFMAWVSPEDFISHFVTKGYKIATLVANGPYLGLTLRQRPETAPVDAARIIRWVWLEMEWGLLQTLGVEVSPKGWGITNH